MDSYEISKKELESVLNSVINKTLGDVDSKGVFEKVKNHKKVTGIAGDVIEQSVIGFPANSYQAPDLIVDGEEIEVKTTGIRFSKKSPKKFEAKEPMTITAVSPETIVNQDFDTSHFWNKLEKLLLIYYHYDSESTVTVSDYADFYIKGFEIFEFPEEERKILENDWAIVKDYIANIHKNHDDPEEMYPTLSSALRDQLMFIDTSPKWPNRPRFRLKRNVVSTIVDRYFSNELEDLDEEILSFRDFDNKLKSLTQHYQGMTLDEIVEVLNIDVKKSSNNNDYDKAIGEKIVLSMFESSEKKLSKVKLFEEVGLTVKTIRQTVEGYRTEDTKLMAIEFDEWLDKTLNFEDSSLHAYFTNPFLFIIFEEPYTKAPLSENVFKGFKRVNFSDDFIYNNVECVWNIVRDLIFNDKLIDEPVTKKSGEQIINKNGIASTAPNFPKGSEYDIFFRGTGTDSSKKPLTINNVTMYRQNLWIKGTVINNLLSNHDFI